MAGSVLSGGGGGGGGKGGGAAGELPKPGKIFIL
tara:strand:- start:632 stop:733 length:102 start_codon:yes stop_codon:yes gene_type:complete